MKPMAEIISKLVTNKKVDINKQYIFFKNNCPLAYNLYDSFSICDIETGEVKYFISYNEELDLFNKWKIYNTNNKKYSPEFKTNSSKELIEWFNK
jgi:hypothetical protein